MTLALCPQDPSPPTGGLVVTTFVSIEPCWILGVTLTIQETDKLSHLPSIEIGIVVRLGWAADNYTASHLHRIRQIQPRTFSKKVVTGALNCALWELN
jgi:hypothetical protein